MVQTSKTDHFGRAEQKWCNLNLVHAMAIKFSGNEQKLLFFVPDNTTRHRNPEECGSLLRQRQNTTEECGSLLRQRQNTTEECGSLLRQRQNTKSWSAIVVILYRIVSKLSGNNYIDIPIQCNIFIHTSVSSIH